MTFPTVFISVMFTSFYSKHKSITFESRKQTCLSSLLNLNMEIRAKGENSKKGKAKAGIMGVSKIYSIGPVFTPGKVPSMGSGTHLINSSYYWAGLHSPHSTPHRNSNCPTESESLVTEEEGAQAETCWSPASPTVTSLQGR